MATATPANKKKSPTKKKTPAKKAPTTKGDKPAVAAPPASKATTPTPAGVGEGKVVEIPLDLILDDTQFRFRVDLRITPLVKSIHADGIQIPVVVRKKGKGKFQLVCGFRRITAAREAGLDAVPAIVRDLSDAASFRCSVLENTARNSLSPTDKALVLQAHRERKLGDDESVSTLLRLTKRQQQHLLSLLTLPKAVQEVIDDPDSHFSGTHGIVLRQLATKYPNIDLDKWVAAVNDDTLSIRDLRKAVNKEHGTGAREAFTGIFREKGTDATKGVFHLTPVKVVVEEMTDGEKATLRADLEKLLAVLA